jgi:uncharacterized membrane protein
MGRTAATRTLTKTLAYRVISLATTASVGYAMTGSLKMAASLGLMNLTVNSAVYFGFEALWAKVSAPAAPAFAAA